METAAVRPVRVNRRQEVRIRRGTATLYVKVKIDQPCLLDGFFELITEPTVSNQS